MTKGAGIDGRILYRLEWDSMEEGLFRFVPVNADGTRVVAIALDEPAMSELMTAYIDENGEIMWEDSTESDMRGALKSWAAGLGTVI